MVYYRILNIYIYNKIYKMEQIYIEPINKNKNYNNLSKKFKIINCYDKINIDYDTSKWIKLNSIIKNNDDLKIFNSNLLTEQKIIIKIGIKDSIIREFEASKILLSIPGFINYLCYFKCNNKLRNINTSIFSNNYEYDKFHILLMKEYESNIKTYKWNNENFNILKSLLKQIFLSLYIAFKLFGFIHNDTHFGNFLLKKQKKQKIIYEYNNEIIEVNTEGYSIVIIDFETSLFDKNKISFDFLCKIFINIINNIKYELNIEFENKDEIIKILSLNKDFEIKQILSLLDNLKYKNIYKLPLFSLSYEEILKNINLNKINNKMIILFFVLFFKKIF